MPSAVAVPSRAIRQTVEVTLWARAAGRCQFDGCNRLLYRSSVTQERVNVAQKAHIYSFATGGPRGRGPYANDAERINEIDNLLLVCHECHTKIDKHPERYPAELLKWWKQEHEDRVELVTGIDPLKRSHVLLYGASIGDVAAQISPKDAMEAMFPEWYPATPQPVTIAMNWQGKDSEPEYWITEEADLVRSFERRVQPLLAEEVHLSIFGWAPIPLLVKFGALITDQVPATVYQRHREPQTWRWLPGPTETHFRVSAGEDPERIPALALALSDRIGHERIRRVLGSEVSIWELTTPDPENDFLRSPDQLSGYRRALRQLLDEIGAAHGKHVPIHIFPAIPVACAIDLGRVRMPKVDAPWILYDHNSRASQFVRTLTIGGSDA